MLVAITPVFSSKVVLNRMSYNQTKVITLANHKTQSSEPIKTRSKARKNSRKRVTIGFGFTSDWMKISCTRF